MKNQYFLSVDSSNIGDAEIDFFSATGVVTAVDGVVSNACCIQFARDSSDRLNKILSELGD